MCEVEGERPKIAGSSSGSDGDGPGWDDFDLVSLESEVILTGMYKNYEELEECLTLEELEEVYSTIKKREFEAMKFTAALKGINLEEDDVDNEYETIVNRGRAKAVGK